MSYLITLGDNLKTHVFSDNLMLQFKDMLFLITYCDNSKTHTFSDNSL